MTHIFLWTIFLLTGSVAIYVGFWITNLMIALVRGAPSVYAENHAMEACFKLADLKKDQLVIDLGCGNAQSLIIACKKFGAKGIGVDRNLYCYLLSRFRVWLYGCSNKIVIYYGDFKKIQHILHDADLVYTYLLTNDLRNIEQWLFGNIGKHTRVVSLSFPFPDTRVPIKTTQTRNLGNDSIIRLYNK